MTHPLATQETETSVTVDLLRELKTKGHLTHAELKDILGLSDSATWAKFESVPLSYDQLRQVLRHAKSDEVRRAFFADLMGGTGCSFVTCPIGDELDLDGDGDVDHDDALLAIGQAVSSLGGTIVDQKLTPDSEPEELRAAGVELMSFAAQVIGIADHITSHRQRRRRCAVTTTNGRFT